MLTVGGEADDVDDYVKSDTIDDQQVGKVS